VPKTAVCLDDGLLVTVVFLLVSCPLPTVPDNGDIDCIQEMCLKTLVPSHVMTTMS